MTSEVSTSQVPGNTNTGTFKGRSFQITLNQIQFYDDIKNYITNLKTFSYLISCKELAPTTNHEHIHIYAHFNQSIKLSIKKLKGAHIEKCLGTPEQNINYITKDGNILDEIGTKPQQGKKNFNFDEILNMNDETILNDDNLNLYEKRMLLNIKNEIIPPMNRTNINKTYNNFECCYLYGNDKHKIFEYALNLIEDNNFDELTYNNGFFNGVSNNASYCILNNFDPNKIDVSTFEDFIDIYTHNLNVKNKIIKNNYIKIIIINNTNTSIFDIYDKKFENLFMESPYYTWKLII